MLEFRHLRSFEAVVRHRKITAAAEELFISQPSLSNTIKSLEKELGFKVFERNTRKLALTEAGEVFYQHTLTVLNHFDNILKEMEDVKSVGGGKLSIGMIESFRYWIPQILLKFKNLYPRVSVKIKEMGPNQIVDAINNYEIHVGITSHRHNDNIFTYLPVFQEKLALIVPLEHRFADLKEVHISELKDEMIIHSLPGYEIRQQLIEACKNAGFTIDHVYETESLETARSLVEAGLGISVVPENYLKFYQSKQVRLVDLKSTIPMRSVYLMYQTERYLQPAIYDFMSMTQKFVKSS